MTYKAKLIRFQSMGVLIGFASLGCALGEWTDAGTFVGATIGVCVALFAIYCED